MLFGKTLFSIIFETHPHCCIYWYFVAGSYSIVLTCLTICFLVDDYLSYFWFLTVMNNLVIVNILKSLFVDMFSFVLHKYLDIDLCHRVGAWLVYRKLSELFPRGCTFLHTHQQCVSNLVALSSVWCVSLFNFSCSGGCVRFLILVLICIFLMTNDV